METFAKVPFCPNFGGLKFHFDSGARAPRPYGPLDISPILLSRRIALGLDSRLNMKYGFNRARKIERFSMVSYVRDENWHFDSMQSMENDQHLMNLYILYSKCLGA
jgi:hypothetical protein